MGSPVVNPAAAAYFASQNPQDQAAITASWQDPNDKSAAARNSTNSAFAAGPFRALQEMLKQRYAGQQANMQNQWYANANAAGAVPAPAPAPAAPAPAAAQPYAGYNPAANVGHPAPGGSQPQPQPAVGGAAVGAVSNMLTNNFGTPPAKPRNVGDEYEAWKQGGRVGPRPEGT